MIDYLRRVSDHVTIGRAFRKGKWTENYFLLCRESSEIKDDFIFILRNGDSLDPPR